MKTFRLNRLYKGMVTLRDTQVQEAILMGGAKIITPDGIMTLNPNQLESLKVKVSDRAFISRFGGGSYHLVDYRFNVD